MKRTKLRDRLLPHYTLAEELVNAISHGAGALLGIVVLIMCTVKACHTQNLYAIIGSVIYGICMITLYAVSCVYHALRPGTAKKVMQILDHCTIYILIAGTYTPILLTGFIPTAPVAGWLLLGVQWGVTALAIALNAVDLKRFRVFSYTAYIVLGWSIIFFVPVALRVLKAQALWLILLGGISYTVGAVLYAIGSKKPWYHSVFHIFVVLGSFLQFLGIYLYVL